MLVAVCADKGSPGVTTTSLAVAAEWPGGPVVVVEADPAGGDLGIVLSGKAGALPATPTVATLAAESLHASESIWERTSVEVSETVRVVPGLLSAEAGAGMAKLWPALADALAASATDVIADVGRISTMSPAMPIIEAADVVVVVMQPAPSSLVHARERIRHLAVERRVIQPVIVTRDRESADDRRDVDQVLDAAQLDGVEPCLHVAWDPTAVGALRSGPEALSLRRFGRSKLLRSAALVGGVLVDQRASGLIEGARG